MTLAENMTGNQAGGPPPRLTTPDFLPVISDPLFLMTNHLSAIAQLAPGDTGWKSSGILQRACCLRVMRSSRSLRK